MKKLTIFLICFLVATQLFVGPENFTYTPYSSFGLFAYFENLSSVCSDITNDVTAYVSSIKVNFEPAYLSYQSIPAAFKVDALDGIVQILDVIVQAAIGSVNFNIDLLKLVANLLKDIVTLLRALFGIFDVLTLTSYS